MTSFRPFDPKPVRPYRLGGPKIDPTSCSAGLRDGSSMTVGSMSGIGVVSMMPLSAMNMSISNPSMGFDVDLKRANKGQKETKSTVAKRTAGVERPSGGVGAGEFLSWRSFLLSFPLFDLFVSAFPSISSLFSLSLSLPVTVSKDGSCFDLHSVVRKVDGEDGILGSSL